MKKACSSCLSRSGVREILYGMPEGPVDESKYVLGDCCVSHNDPTLKCIECGWKGENVNNTQGPSKEISMIKLQEISKMTDSQIDSYAKQIWENLGKQKMGSDDGNSKG